MHTARSMELTPPVADEHEFELELGPLGYLREGSAKSLIVPAITANFGLGSDREIVLEGKVVRRIGDVEDEPRTSLEDDTLSIKQVLRRGALQDESGMSVASECGILLPTIHGEPGAGATCALVGSQRWSTVTLHLNGALGFNRDHHWNRFVGLIAEGPNEGVVRPAAEIFAENELNGTPRTSPRPGQKSKCINVALSAKRKRAAPATVASPCRRVNSR